MRYVLISAVLLIFASPGKAQDAVPDSAELVYSPLDSLETGIDLVLKALKMNRRDLTFRGDYLEPDEYRIKIVDDIMLEPVGLIGFAEKRLSRYSFSELKSEPFMETGGMSGQGSYSTDPGDNNFPPELMKYDESVIRLFEIILSASGKKKELNNDGNKAETSLARRDSIIEGFTIIIEENEEDEFLSVEELDSLSNIEEDWSFAVKRLAGEYSGKYRQMDIQYSLVEYLTENRERIYNSICETGYESVKTDFGQIIIGDTTGNHYEGDLFIVIDPGGNDTYDIELEGTGNHTYIVDFDGGDTYNMPSNRVSPYFFGANMIIDYDGDDLYNAGSWTLGAGLFGVGILWDLKGDDRYYGDTFTMGAGCFGVGILRDDEGNDSYHAALFSQGFGFVDGVGVLVDNSGNDNYFAGGKYKDFIRYDDHYLSLSQGFGYGLRPKMSGGIGLLIDKSGNDVYISDIFGQGASYWYSMGMLADGGGNDQYLSFQYAQGNGTHMSLGILYDVSGDDVYSAKGVSQGCGHDRAAGFLIDLDGDDNYNAYDLCQGAGSANGLGMIADIRGKDVYIVRSDKNTQGYGNPRRDYGSIGIFLDLAGKDGYSGGLGRDNHWWTYSKWGAGIDK